MYFLQKKKSNEKLFLAAYSHQNYF